MRIFLLALLLGCSVAVADDEPGPEQQGVLATKAELTGHKGWVRTLAFHPEGALLASGGPDRALRIWDVEKKEQVAIHILPRGG